MCREKKDKRVDKNKTAEETTSQAACKLRPAKKEATVNQGHEERKKYEYAIKVVNAVSRKGMRGVTVKMEIDGDEYPYKSHSDGRIKIHAKAPGIKRDLKVALKPDSKYTVKGSNHSVTSQEEGGISAVIELETQMLEINSADPHFVPTGKADAENLQIQYTIAKVANILPKPEVFLCIRSNYHLPDLVYKYKLTDAEMADGKKMLKWDGKTNCDNGPLFGKLISPMYGPYTLTLEVRGHALVSNKVKTEVAFHSIVLEKGNYLDDPGSPPARQVPVPAKTSPTWADHVKWVQYRLNLLGYFAGKVDGVVTNQTKRAIKRYTYEMINHDESEDITNMPFLSHLAGNNLKTELFDDDAVISDKTKAARIYIQNNYYYHVGDYNTIDGQWIKEKEKLDRFQYPIAAVPKLKSRNGNAVFVPDAMEGVEIKWTVADPDGDVSMIPPFDANIAPSKARVYVKGVYDNVKNRNGQYPPFGDNCPQRCGGVRANESFISDLYAYCAVTKIDRATYTSEVCSDQFKDALYGKSAVLFIGSKIAGDNYQLQAEVSFDGLPNELELKQTYDALPVDDRLAKTGIMTVWRKRRIVQVIDWLPAQAPAVDWTETVEQFKAAFIELDTSNAGLAMIGTLVNNGNVGPFLQTMSFYLQQSVEPRFKPEVQVGNLQFNPDNIVPLVYTQRTGETDVDYRDRVGAVGYNVASILTNITLGKDGKISLAEWIRGIVGQTKRPGIILMRALPFQGVDLHVTTTTVKKGFLSNKTVATVNTTPAFARDEGKVATGAPMGLAFISEGWRKNYKDGFLNTHEMAHCLYLNHPHDGPALTGDQISQNKTYDHDMGDVNDTMRYLDNQPAKGRDAIKLGKDSQFKSYFCGKCLLKLRGWKVNGLDAQITKLLPHTHTDMDHPFPCNPLMYFVEYAIQEGTYEAKVDDKIGYYPLKSGAIDPEDPSIPLGPLRFLHVHKLKWESSNGDLPSLAGVKTREKVVFDKPTQGPPFCEAADPDQDFVQEGDNADKGECFDDHSVAWPGLICSNPRIAGKISATQHYQYQLPPYAPGTWKTITNAVFILEKEVYEKTRGNWVLKFRKYNKADENPIPFNFEVEYKIGPAPLTLPNLVANPNAQHLPGKNFAVAGSAAIFHAGPYKANYVKTGSPQVVTLAQLQEMGYIAD